MLRGDANLFLLDLTALPKDIVRALTNGDVLTAQQRQRFIDKITMDIMKAKGVPQPKQIQEIALQVANMYPRSLVILPEGKRKSNLRRKRGETDDGSEHTVAKKPRFSQVLLRNSFFKSRREEGQFLN